MEAEKNKPTGRRDILFYIIGIAVIVAVVLAIVALRHRYQTACDASQPQNIMDVYMEQGLADDLSAAIASYSQSKAAPYQSAGEIAAALEQQLLAETWSYEVSQTDSDERPVYTLYCDRREMGRVTLNISETSLSSFGKESWQTTEAAFDFDAYGRTVTVVAPYGCAVYVNGAELSEDLVQETAGLYPQLQEYELQIPQANQLMVYVLEEIFTEIAVEFEDGFTLQADEEGAVYYALPVCSAAAADELIAYCSDFIRAYVNFTLNKEALWTVQQFTVPDGTLYNSLTQASLGLDWGNGIDAEVEKLEIKQFTYYGNAITCRAVYKLSTNTGERNETAQLLLVKTEKDWRIAVIEEMS